ncbi:MAG: hypothetical protein KF850_20040 [Labilithrix sp.]|nr:hypothetical protein [Labilithrix sp.]
MVKPPQKPTTMKNERAEEPTIAATNEPTSTTIAAESPKADAPKAEPLPNVASISDADLQAMLKVLRTEVRRRENEREASRPKVGSKVRILRGRPKYVGKVGTAVVVRKSRCFVAVPEVDAPAYLLISDVELVER